MYKSLRNSNFELLRTVATLMIIGLHYLHGGMGGVLGAAVKGSLNYYIVYFLESLFIVGVNLFIIISGYFLIDSPKFKISKVINIIFAAYFYGAFLYLVSVFIGVNSFSIKNLIKETNILLMGNYWFIITFVILYLISPFINILLDNINKNLHKTLIVISVFFFSIWPSFLPYGPNNDEGYGIISFVLLYCIGAYIKKHYSPSKSSIIYFMIYLLCSVTTFIFSIYKGTWSPWSYNFIVNIIGAVALFLFFSNLDIKSKFINYMATYTLQIYLIHINPLMIMLVFKYLLKCQEFYFSKYFIIHIFISIIVMYIVSVAIELLRRSIIILILNKIVYRYNFAWKAIDEKLDMFFMNNK